MTKQLTEERKTEMSLLDIVIPAIGIVFIFNFVLLSLYAMF